MSIKIPKVEQMIATAKQKLNQLDESSRLLKEDVTAEDIAKVVARWTGVPVSRLLESESNKLSHLEDSLAKRVVGQPRAITAIANAIRRSRAGISDADRPIGSFMFLGPTGVGKTETAKALAEQLFDDESAMVRIDMSEYMQEHSVSRLIGSPPGYVGYEQGGQLTEAVRRRPYAVILFDEVEKAHPDIFNALLQILDDGRLTDGQGRTVNFTNTVIIMTSNLGSDIILDAKPEDDEAVQASLQQRLQAHFKPEFLNRVDDIVVFDRLDKSLMQQIVDVQLQRVVKRLKDAKSMTLTFTDELQIYLAQQGYDPAFGARPLKRLIQTAVLDPLALDIIEGRVKDGDKVAVEYKNNSVNFSTK